MNNSIDQLLDKLNDSKYLADLFLVLHLEEIEQPTASNTETLQVLVPQCLHNLLTKDAKGSASVLKALITWARPETRAFSELALDSLVDDIRSRYMALMQYRYVLTVSDESDSEVTASLAHAIPGAKKQTGVIQRTKGVVRKAIGTVLSYSKRTGIAILMRGRQLVELLRDWIISLELPAKADQLVKQKTVLTSRLFAFKGGQAAKFFVGVTLGVAGLFASAKAIVNISGLALAFVDP